MDIKPFSYQGNYEEIGMWEMWQLLLDASNAVEFGFAKYRLPIPGSSLSVEKAKKKVEHIEDEWDKEWMRRDSKKVYSGSPPFTNMPINAQLWLASEVEKNFTQVPKRAASYDEYASEYHSFY